jgi:halimadienyl-diphosphate synthase
MDPLQNFYQVLRNSGFSKISRSPYDTAWIARLGEFHQPLSLKALNWLSENQLPDGSWGASMPQYYHDRVICTLAAMIALTKQGKRAQDRRQIERGQQALENLGKGATRGLMADPAGSTIGFEMIMPTLLSEAESLKIISHQGEHVLGRLTRQRAAKLATLPGRLINRYVTVAFSSEMVGVDGLGLLDLENLQEANGSVAHSPAATAFYVAFVNPDQKALKFLQEITIDGAAPYIGPIDVFEHAWVLWNLALTKQVDKTLLELSQRLLDALEKFWKPGKGISAVGELTLIDGDTTAMAYDVLTDFGHSADLAGVLYYEDTEHFLCFPLEANPSISTNVHVLGALRTAGFELQHPSIQKIIKFLKEVQTADSFWFDKWHASPYYTTSHAIIATAGYDDNLVTTAVNWILKNQNKDGSWGYYFPTAEETAYCLQALTIWKQHGGKVSSDILKQGQNWLIDHSEPPYPMLWIGKCLYCPELVIQSAILSAIMLVDNLN